MVCGNRPANAGAKSEVENLNQKPLLQGVVGDAECCPAQKKKPPQVRGERPATALGGKANALPLNDWSSADYCVSPFRPSLASSYFWMMIRGVTIIIRLWASRPMPTLRNRRLM